MKVCGLSRPKDIDAAADAGADAVGFIVGFPESPRNQSLERAARLRRRVPPFVHSVLVTTTDVVRNNGKGVEQVAPDSVQLYGDHADPRALRRMLGVPIIRPLRIGPFHAGDPRSAVRGFDAVITDTYDAVLAGGTGRRSDWGVCRTVRERVAPLPMVLSGGLTPENVIEAIRVVRPYAVDASSGVESSPGRKDRAKMFAFVRNAKETH